MLENPIETRIATLYKDENEIITIHLKNCDDVDEFDVMDFNLVIRQMSAQKPALKLVLTNSKFDLTKKAKEMASKEENLSPTRARALVVSNSIKASFKNFLHQFDSKTYPQQYFTSKKQAYEWLLNIRQKEI